MPTRKSAPKRSLNGAARFRPPGFPGCGSPCRSSPSFVLHLPLHHRPSTCVHEDQANGTHRSLHRHDNYAAVLGDPEFWQALTNSLLYAICVVPLMVLLPLPAGPPRQVARPRHRLLPRLYYLPAISSLVVISLAWRYLLDQRGPVNNLLTSWGLDAIPFLSNQWLILLCAMIITLWQGLPTT